MRHYTALVVLPLHQSNLIAKKVKVVDLILFWKHKLENWSLSLASEGWVRVWFSANLLQKLFRQSLASVFGFVEMLVAFSCIPRFARYTLVYLWTLSWATTPLGNREASDLHFHVSSVVQRSSSWWASVMQSFLKRNVSWRWGLVGAITLQSCSCDWKPWKWHYPARRTTCGSHLSLFLALTGIC